MSATIRYAAGIGIAATLLAACGAPQPPIGPRQATPARSSSGYQVIYNFQPAPDGSAPLMTLLAP